MITPTASHLRRWLMSLIALGGLCAAGAAAAVIVYATER